MVHPAAYALAIGIGVGVVLYTLLFESRRSEQPQRSQSSNRTPFNDFNFRPDPNEATQCPICLELLDAATIEQLDCGHRYHQKCLEDSVGNGLRICAYCRKPFKYD